MCAAFKTLGLFPSARFVHASADALFYEPGPQPSVRRPIPITLFHNGGTAVIARVAESHFRGVPA